MSSESISVGNSSIKEDATVFKKKIGRDPSTPPATRISPYTPKFVRGTSTEQNIKWKQAVVISEDKRTALYSNEIQDSEMQIISKEEYELATSPQKNETTPSPLLTESPNSTPDSEWKSSNKKKVGRVGQGLGKQLKSIKNPATAKTGAKRSKQIKKKSRRKAVKSIFTSSPVDFHCEECNEDFGTG